MAIDLSQALATKQTGKALPTSPATQTNIMGQAAEAEQQQVLTKAATSAKTLQDKQAAEIESIKAESSAQQAALDMDRVEQEYQRVDFVNKLMSQVEQSSLDLENRRDALQLEAAAHNLMMQDETYIQQIRDIGRRRRLVDQGNFEQEMSRMAYGSQLDMLISELGWTEDEAASGRSVIEKIANMDLDEALAVVAADSQMRTAGAISAGISENAKDIGQWYEDQKNAPTDAEAAAAAEAGPPTTGITPSAPIEPLPPLSLPSMGPAAPSA